jgi:hypothetical protein
MLAYLHHDLSLGALFFGALGHIEQLEGLVFRIARLDVHIRQKAQVRHADGGVSAQLLIQQSDLEVVHPVLLVDPHQDLLLGEVRVPGVVTDHFALLQISCQRQLNVRVLFAHRIDVAQPSRFVQCEQKYSHSSLFKYEL